MKKRYIIAIDGPAGAGKSTVSKALAKKLGYIYIDTGAMYRSIALKALRHGVAFTDHEKIIALATTAHIELKESANKNSLLDIFIDGENVTEKIRTEEVSQGASKVSAIAGVRRVLQDKQRKIGKNGGIVMEGRDIGTVVFPHAEFKFYMDASVEERALRRFRELTAKGQQVTLEDITKDIRARDERDSTRRADPLKKADDSIYIDSTGLSIEQTADVLAKRISNG